MNRFSLLVLAAFAFGSVFVNAADPPPSRIEVAKLRPPQEGCVNQDYWGEVIKVTKTSITIRHEKGEPVTFKASETLAAGKIPMEPRPVPGSNRNYTVMASYMYRLTDVKVGDQISIQYAHLGGISICDHICINKRPGGLVPPLPQEAEALRHKRRSPNAPPPNFISYHEWMNAHWNLVDHDTAFPAKFGNMRRFPVAPAPREVKPDEPPAAP